MPSFPAGGTGGAAASLIGVITELKATPGNCVVPPSKKYCVPRLEQRLEIRIIVVTHTRNVDQYLAVLAIAIRADERKCRIPAHHLAVPNIDDAAA
jgi:hypothetical protein